MLRRLKEDVQSIAPKEETIVEVCSTCTHPVHEDAWGPAAAYSNPSALLLPCPLPPPPASLPLSLPPAPLPPCPYPPAPLPPCSPAPLLPYTPASLLPCCPPVPLRLS